MKKILLLCLTVIICLKAHCQEIPWGSSPEQIMRLAPQLGYQLDEQKTNEHGNIFLNYRVQDGMIVSYVFSNRKLLFVNKYYDTKIIVPPTPTGEERTDGSTAYWGDKEKHILTMRKYQDRFVIDRIIELNE